MASRPAGFGMTAELERKQAAKYDPSCEKDARDFIREKTGQTVGEGQSNFQKDLKSGVILCQLANALKPGSVKKINESTMAFKQMENIGNFLKVCETQLGVKPSDLFQTADLYDGKNVNQVVTGILAVKRKVTGGESTANKREFTEEQLKAGQNVIGLQMGSNKGASQAGQHDSGRPRQVAGTNVYK